VSAAGSVDELEVQVDRVAVPAEPDRHFMVTHLIEDRANRLHRRAKDGAEASLACSYPGRRVAD